MLNLVNFEKIYTWKKISKIWSYDIGDNVVAKSLGAWLFGYVSYFFHVKNRSPSQISHHYLQTCHQHRYNPKIYLISNSGSLSNLAIPNLKRWSPILNFLTSFNANWTDKSILPSPIELELSNKRTTSAFAQTKKFLVLENC